MAKRKKDSHIAPGEPAFPDASVEYAFSTLRHSLGSKYPKFRIDAAKKTIRAAFVEHPAFRASLWSELKRLAVAHANDSRLLDVYHLCLLLRVGGEDVALAEYLPKVPDGPARGRLCEVLLGNANIHMKPAGDAQVVALLPSSSDPSVLVLIFVAEFRVAPDAARKRWRRVLQAREPVAHVAPILDAATYVDPKTIAKLCADLGHYHADTDKVIRDAFAVAADKSKPAFRSFFTWATTQPVSAHIVERATNLLYAFAGAYSVKEVTKPMHALAAACTDKKAAAALARTFKKFAIPTAPRAPGSRRA